MKQLLQNLIKKGNIKDLDVEDIGGGEIVRRLRPTLFSEAVRKIPTVNLSKCGVTRGQIRELLRGGLQSDSKLRSLNISFNTQLSLLQTELISSIANLETLNLSGCDLTPSQISILFRDIRDKNYPRDLDISYNNLSQVELEMISRVLSSSLSPLRRLNLSYSQLTRERIVFLLTDLYVGPVVRRTLDIRQDLPAQQLAAIREEARKLNIVDKLRI